MSAGITPPPGAPCPECGTALRAKAEDLLVRFRIVCPGCGLTLRLDPIASARAMSLLREIDTAEKQVLRTRKQSL
jgi:hypothetical protein